MLSIRRFRNYSSRGSEPRALPGGSGRAGSPETASLALSFQFSETPEALRTRLFARTGRFFARPGPPGLDFGSSGRSRPRF